MARADEWAYAFLERYRRLIRPHDWDDPHADEWLDFVAGWVHHLDANAVTEPEAESAATKLLGCPPRFRNDHLPALVAVVKQARESVKNPVATTYEMLNHRRQECAVMAKRREKLAAEWETLPASVRERIRAEVLAENPGLAAFEPFVRRLCLDRMARATSA